jgi:uncharacterized protein YndB with AHSA1/START domain
MMNENNRGDSSKQEFVYHRTFKAPRQLVFEAYSQPEHLKNWWGPKDMPINIYAFEFKVGGTFHYGMVTPGGESFGKIIYQLIDKPQALAFVVSFCDAEGNPTRHPLAANWPLEVMSHMDFVDLGDETRIEMRSWPINCADDERELYFNSVDGMTQGTDGMMETFENYLAEITQA